MEIKSKSRNKKANTKIAFAKAKIEHQPLEEMKTETLKDENNMMVIHDEESQNYDSLPYTSEQTVQTSENNTHTTINIQKILAQDDKTNVAAKIFIEES